MVKIIEGTLVTTDQKFGIVVSRFNELISRGLMEGAIDCLKRHGAKDSDIDVVWAPGSFEVPLVAKMLAQKKKYAAVICLGAVIRGSTPHFDFVAAEAAKGIAKISLDSNLPIIFGILTTDTLEQAMERAGAKPGNKGFQAAMSAIEMANLSKTIE